MSFFIDTTIPAAGNNPSNDQPKMLANNVATAGWMTVDHVGSGTLQAGLHNQSSYIAQPLITTLVNPVLGANPSNGIAYVNSAANNDFYYFNGTGVNQSTYPLNIIRSYCYVTVAATVPTIVNAFNIISVVRTAVGIYQINFVQPNGSNSYGWQVSIEDTTATTGVRSAYSKTRVANQLTVQFSKTDGTPPVLFDPTGFTIMITVI